MLTKSRPYRKFIILSSPRSGTHLMRTTLRDHVDIVARTEMFNPDFLKGKQFGAHTPAKEILEKYIFREYPRNIKAVGFIIHRSGAPFGNWPDLWSILEEDKDIYVISLRRRNLLRRYLSYQTMRTFRGDEPTALSFDPQILEEDFIRQEKEVDDFDQRFSGHPLIRIYYEDLCNDYRATVDKTLKFLKVKPRKIWPSVEVKPYRKLDEAISNFAALKVHFADTKWASFFMQEDEIIPVHRPEVELKKDEKIQVWKETLANLSFLKPYVHIRNRYQESWLGALKIMVNDWIFRSFHKIKGNSERHYQYLPSTSWAFYSERIEELLIRSFFKDRRNGVFADVGCALPITNSNTFYLERHLGWTGVAVDANTDALANWQRYRPKTKVTAAIISDVISEEESFYKSGLLGSIQKERPFGEDVVCGEEIKLTAITLDKLFEDNNLTRIDFLSIDIEESEVIALNGFSIQKYRPELICVEVFLDNKAKILSYFATHDYRLIEAYQQWDKVNMYFTPKHLHTS